MNTRARISAVIFAMMVAGLLGASPTQAATIPLSAHLDGASANAGAGTGSPGIGNATILFDDSTNLLSWDITWSGLLGTPTLMHFHGPALPHQNAGVEVGTGVAGPPVIGSAVLNASQGADLLAELWYLNLHTSAFSGGEIRGQVTPEPGTLVLVGAGGMAILRRRRKRSNSR